MPATKAKSRRSASPTGRVAAKLVRIGNSRGIRLPKSLLDQSAIGDEVTLRVSGGSIIIEPVKNPRAGWEEAILKSIKKHGPIPPIDPDWEYMPNEFDEKEWTW